MSDDLSKKIKQIADLLGQDSMPDGMKGLLSLLANSPEGKDEKPQKTSDISFRNEERAPKPELDDSLEMMTRIKKLMDTVNTSNDPRLNLITAIKPFLSSRRQQKLSNCMRLLQMTKLTRILNDNEKGGL